MSEKKRVFLKIYHRGVLKATRQFSDLQISVGSAEGTSVQLKHSSVHPWHALIEWREDQKFYISDLGSPKGTMLKGKPVLEHVLHHGDEITVGEFRFQFLVGLPFFGASPMKAKKALKPKDLTPEKHEGAASDSEGLEEDFVVEEKTEVVAEEHTGVKPLPTQEVIPPEELEKKTIFVGDASSQDLDIPSGGDFEKKTSSLLQKQPVASGPASPTRPSEEPALPAVPEDIPDEEEDTSFSNWDKSSTPPLSETKTPSVTDLSLESEKEQDLSVTRSFVVKKDESDSLEKTLPSSATGPMVEVIVSWKNRILSVSHFDSKTPRTITFGSHSRASIFLPNMVGTQSYRLLTLGSQIMVHVLKGVKPCIITRKSRYGAEDMRKKSLLVKQGSGEGIVLGMQQLVRLDFSPAVRVYVRYTQQVQKAALASFFDFNFSEMVGIMMSFVFMSGLLFYLYLLSPPVLLEEDKWEEAHLQKATIEFKKPQRKVRLKMAKNVRKKSMSLPVKKAKKSKKAGVKKRGRAGKLGQVASKKKSKSKKKTVTSAKPGGSLTTGKRGGSARSPRPDPTKVGLLGAFGTKGTQTELDKAYSGAGELAGLAEEVTGHAGQKESYAGKGIGTQFKNVGAGGQGSNIIGVSGGIKTKGRGGGGRGYGRGGSLGSRGGIQLVLSTEDWDVDGGVDKNAIYRAIRRKKPRMESCYNTILNQSPNVRGKVLMQWEIFGNKARKIQIVSNTVGGGKAFVRCLKKHIQDITFLRTGLKAGQIADISIPFTFQKR